MKAKLLVVPFLICCVVAEVAAEQVNRMDTVYVTAPRAAASDVDVESQTARVTVIKREEFGADASTVADILRKETGVQIRQLGGLGSFSSISVRGSTSNQVNVYLNGVLLNGAYGGSVDLSRFLLGAIEEIEIYRSNVPIQLGRSGIGGAINIKTRKSSAKEAKEIGLGYGSFKTRKTAYMANHSFDEANLLVSGEYLSSDNDFSLTNDNGTPSNITDDFEEHRNNSDFDQYDVLLSTSTSINEKLELNASAQLFTKDQGVPDTLNLEQNDASLRSDFASVNLALDHWWKPDVTMGYDVFLSLMQQRYQDLDSRVGLAINDDKSVSQVVGLAVKSSISRGAHLFSFNLGSKYEDYSIDNYFSNTEQSYSRWLVNASAQDEWLSGAGDLTLSLGGHGLFNYDKSDDADEEDSELNYSLQAGALYQVSPSIKIRSNISRDIRIPQLNEKFGDKGFSVGNEDLEPETAINLDLGVSYETSKLQSSLTLFHRNLNDAILTIYDSRGIGKAQNASKASVSGAEIQASYQFDNPWSLSLRSTLQDTEDTSDSRDFGGQSLPGIFDVTNVASISYAHQFYRFSLEHQFKKDGFYDRSGIEAMPDIKRVNFVAAWKNQRHKVELSLENLNNQKSQEINRFPGPGRSVFVSYLVQI